MSETTKLSYELLFILPGSLKESAAKTAAAKWKSEIEKFGKVLNETTWANRPLAYKINKEQTGTYVIYHFETTDSSKIPELESSLRLDGEVMRAILMRTPKDYTFQDYSEEDLEHDYSKVKRDLFNEEDEASKTAPKSKSKSATK